MIWVFPEMVGFPPKSSIWKIGFSFINHPFLGFSHYFWKHQFVSLGILAHLLVRCWARGVLHHLQNERNLGSMKPFSEGDWIPRVCFPQKGYHMNVIATVKNNMALKSYIREHILCLSPVWVFLSRGFWVPNDLRFPAGAQSGALSQRKNQPSTEQLHNPHPIESLLTEWTILRLHNIQFIFPYYSVWYGPSIPQIQLKFRTFFVCSRNLERFFFRHTSWGFAQKPILPTGLSLGCPFMKPSSLSAYRA